MKQNYDIWTLFSFFQRPILNIQQQQPLLFDKDIYIFRKRKKKKHEKEDAFVS